MSKSSSARAAYVSIGLVLLALLLAQATGRLELPPLNALDRQIHDARLSLFAPATRDERIVILDIDDRALAQQGRWPWPRRRLAGLIDKAFDEGALLMGMDLIMAEPDDSAGLALIEDLARKDSRLLAQLPTLRARFDDDAVMANALRRHPVVLGFYLSDREGQSAARPPPLMPAPASLPAWPGFGGNLAVLQEAAGQAGFLNALVDADGLVRRSLLVARQGDAAYGSLPLMLAEQLLGTAGTEPLMMNGQLQGLSLHTARGPRLMRTGAFGEVFVPYRGPSGQYATLSAAELLDPRAEPARLRAALAGKVVLLGSSAAGLLDQHSMPLQAAYAGVATHASVLSGLLDGQLYHARNDAPAIAALLLLGIAAILLLALPRMNLLPGTALTAALLAALTGHNLWAWSAWHEAWPLTAPLVLTVSLWSLHLLLMQLQERAARQRLQTLFGQYVPVSRVQAMARAPDREHYTLESRAAELSVMFADVRGFTSIAETLAPADLAALMNAYFSAMTEVIGAHQGTLDKYIGDAVMAFWGAPQDDPLHARHAVLAAQAMLARLTLLNEDFAARGWPRLEIRIGINTGTVIVGDLGSQERRAYTVLGDAVNVAARLQALCTTHGVSLLIGPETARQADMPCTSLGPTTLRGHRRQLLIYAPALTAESGPEPVPQEEDEEPPSACR